MDPRPECWSWKGSIQLVTFCYAFYTVYGPHKCCLTHILLSCLAHSCRGLMEGRVSALIRSPAHQNRPHSRSHRCTLISSWCKCLHIVLSVTIQASKSHNATWKQFNSSYLTWLALELWNRAHRSGRLVAQSICQTELSVSHRIVAGRSSKLAEDYDSPRPSLRVRKSKLKQGTEVSHRSSRKKRTVINKWVIRS